MLKGVHIAESEKGQEKKARETEKGKKLES